VRAADLVVIAVYLAGILAVGIACAPRARTLRAFTTASGGMPSWAVGLSIFGSYLSSNTFLGVPGKAFAEDWSSFVFSLSLPIAAFVAVRVFVPFYRAGGRLSAYAHLEARFGRWARTYGMACYLLTQLARIGSILFGVALVVAPLTGWSPLAILLGTGFLVIAYTLLGGIEAVVWTDVVQSVVLAGGALLACAWAVAKAPGNLADVLGAAAAEGKLGLGGFGPELHRATFWVVLAYGILINLNNFGIDQSYVQRYLIARSEREAGRSVWLAALLYLPISLLFFVLGTALWAFYQADASAIADLTASVAASPEGQLSGAQAPPIGDRALPHFIVHYLPPGLPGVLVAALLASAMSSLDTSLNSSAAVLHEDVYRTYLRPDPSPAQSMRVLRGGTVLVGLLGIAVAIAMLGVRSLLDAWWLLSGAFAGGLLGLFLLGLLARQADRFAAALAATIGVATILWLTLSPRLDGSLARLRNPLHANLTIVVGTLVIFGVGVAVSWLRGNRGGVRAES
jgi:SSS family solute:Na+ symporter